ncbi:unnamed protein product, partial [Meganyctiphanes norvegica]
WIIDVNVVILVMWSPPRLIGVLVLVATCFVVRLRTAQAQPTACKELAASYGILESPVSTIGSYDNNVDICWQITVAKGNYVLLQSDYFDVEGGKPCKDWLKVSDTKEELTLSKPLCGTITEMHIESKGNTLFLHFKTDADKVAKGFKLRWKSIRNLKCEDLISDCTGLKNEGYCDTFSTAMEWNCRKTCDLCEGSLAKYPENRGCGKSFSSVTKIYGGSKVPIHKYPWQVGLSHAGGSGLYHCGGTIINSDYILTAAHCFYTDLGSPNCKMKHHDKLLQIGVGDSDQTSPFDDGFIVYAEEVIIHPEYNCNTYDYDFALLKLEQSLKFENHEFITPVCLPEDDKKTYENITGSVTGWGMLSEGYQPDILQETDVKILDENCDSLNHPLHTTMCAGWPGVGERDACQGDSGGPLMVEEEGRFVQVGVVSGGKGCGTPNNPGIYGRISKIIDWINNPTSINRIKLSLTG